MAEKHQQISDVKATASTVAESSGKDIAAPKEAFRRHQRELPFSEKMQIAFALAKRDKSIKRAVPLSKKSKDEKSK